MFNTTVICYKDMDIEEFKKLELEDVNYSGDLFTWCRPEYDEIIKEQLLHKWLLGKAYRIDEVIKQRAFYVENCDIQTPDTFEYLLDSLVEHDISEIIFLRRIET